MATTAITGKVCTFTYATQAGTAQITTAKIDESANSSTIQTLGGSVAIAQGVESKVTCDFLYDGENAASFYGALKAALMAGSAGALSIAADDSTWTGQAIVTALSAEMPADNAVTCSAEFTVSGALPFTAGTVVADESTTLTESDVTSEPVSA
jgi:predicted secreted protein